ncbi:hypothetical protein GDO81_009020 [Engystomops pustulosus]|uniref:C-type lectin domain-containing protein n=1 Tax=Engystomops pustulosus TaxID=76066 RepID=A0AAV7BNB2_ENGPU|nr:hypothetical protein GDO81_009020 [Engystomops pustulosus]
MDSESGITHERLCENERQSGRRWSYPSTQKSVWISYGLLALLYVLILTLFITVVSEVHNLSSTMDDLHKSLKKKTCEDGWKQFDDSCYSLTVFKAAWAKIRKSCLKKGADLTVITSAREQIFLTSYSGSSSFKRYWIGLHDMDEEGNWMWIDGSDYKTSYQNWKKGEPNDNDDDEDCAHLWTSGEWNDIPCDYDDAYGICEKKL